MQIEIIGCTGSGKSILVKGVLQYCHDQQIEATSGDEFVLKLAHLHWIKGHYTRTIAIDVISILSVLLNAPKHAAFIYLILKILFESPTEVSWFVRLNILRNTIKKLGVYEIVLRFGSKSEIVLLDEGTLHTAHYLFVNLYSEPSGDDLSAFSRSVPLPDIVIYLKREESILVARTLLRGHKRIPEKSPVLVERFIKRALEMFEIISSDPNVQPKLLTVDEHNDITAPTSDPIGFSFQTVLSILQPGLDIVNQSASPGSDLIPT